MGVKKYANGFELTLHPSAINEPWKWKDSRLVFVCSMSDLFHERVPDGFIQHVFWVMAYNPRPTYQVLTKRPNRMLDFQRRFWPDGFPDWLWFGTSVENSKVMWRVDVLREVRGTGVRFLSCEPLLGPLDGINLRDIGWVIVGGESGPNHRPMDKSWAIAIRDSCQVAGIPFFYKQGSGPKPGMDRILGYKTYEEMPNRR
jgi:protein gp37